MIVFFLELFLSWPHGTILTGFLVSYLIVFGLIFSFVISNLLGEGKLSKLMLISRIGSRVYNGKLNP
jgi:hypothetical protein